MKDIEIKNNNVKFKYRVSGLLIKDNKLLVVKINDNSFYCLPGGHVELLENSNDAIIREFKEETGFDVQVEKFLFVTENFFKSGTFDCHELGMYYLLKSDNIPIKDFNKNEDEGDKITRLSFKWIDVDNISCVKPEFLKEKIDVDNIKHLIIKDDKIVNE